MIKSEKIITIDELKSSDIYNEDNNSSALWDDSYVNEAISIATINMDYLSGFELLDKISTLNDKQLNTIKFACVKYVLHLLRKGVEYMRGQSSSSMGGVSWSVSNPDDPYYLPPEVQIALKKVNLLPDFILNKVDTPNSNDNFNSFADDTFLGYQSISLDEANSNYVRYDRIESNDDTIKYNVIGVVDKKILDLSLNFEAVNLKFQDYIAKSLDTWEAGIRVRIFNSLIDNAGFLKQLEKKIEDWLDKNKEFDVLVEKATIALLEKDSKFIDDLGKNEQLIEKLENKVTSDISKLTEQTYIKNVKDAKIDTLNDVSVGDNISSILKRLEYIEGDMFYSRYQLNEIKMSNHKLTMPGWKFNAPNWTDDGVAMLHSTVEDDNTRSFTQGELPKDGANFHATTLVQELNFEYDYFLPNVNPEYRNEGGILTLPFLTATNSINSRFFNDTFFNLTKNESGSNHNRPAGHYINYYWFVGENIKDKITSDVDIIVPSFIKDTTPYDDIDVINAIKTKFYEVYGLPKITLDVKFTALNDVKLPLYTIEGINQTHWQKAVDVVFKINTIDGGE